MRLTSRQRRPLAVLLSTLPLLAAAGHAGGTRSVPPESNPYSEAFLRSVRGLARAVPGELPTAVGYLSVQDDSSLGSDAVEGAPRTKVYQVTPVFQVRYRQGWVMVDAGYDHEQAGSGGTYFQDRYDQILGALRGARLIVITHEHGDHVGTLILPAVARDVAGKTLLNKQQEQTLVFKPHKGARLDAATARRFLVVDYERALPIAPGVVLIRAPGHTPGSQIVYVKLASGREMMLVGDVVWHMAGIETGHQKPDSTSTQMKEDRTTIEQQIAWLKTTVAPAGIAIAVSHDGTELQTLVHQGVLANGLDLSAP